MTGKAIPRITGGILAALLAAYQLCLPKDIFKGTCYSTVVTDRNGELLGARIADDGQWRFPPSDSVPVKFRTALIEFEDRWFAFHHGVNPVAIARAATGNIKAGKVTSGGSTITMQVIRMSRGKERTLRQKLTEAILATRLEFRYSKKEIIGLYAAHAPFGGNVVGLEAASWRYFGRPPEELSWGEAATLAVLPNAPTEIHPGKNRSRLKEKRDRLLKILYKHGHIDSLDLALACDEPLPMKPMPLPQEAHHLTEYYWKTSPGKRIRTTIDIDLQRRVQAVADQWNDELTLNGICDLAAIVEDVRTGEVLAYIGNANPARKRPGSEVDIIRSPRSTGSILKPVLYCAMLQEGEILPNTLLPDTPINLNGFSPQNFNRKFNGAVPASEALARSLNVPSVHMLKKFGVPKFLGILRKSGMTTLGRSASHYGLSLILGGAEGTLGEVTSLYSRMSASYQSADTVHTDSRLRNFPLKDKSALWWTFDALKEVNRPDEMDWRLVRSVKKVAWKTGTSYGFRDAWAVGVTPDYAVGVWAGNAQGQGVPGLVGARAAGPVMFDMFNMLPSKEYDQEYSRDGWFKEPVFGDYVFAEVCHESGHLRNIHCKHIDTLALPRKSVHSATCPYHKMIDGKLAFVLSPSMEWYYRQQHPEYSPLSPRGNGNADTPMEFIYPEGGAVIYIPRQLDGTIQGITFNLAHRNPTSTVYWHLDNEYVGETRMIHNLTLTPAVGKHTVTVVDEDGNSLSVGFTIAENR